MEPLHEGRLTLWVLLASVVAASGGLLFGYDLGVTGGVVSMSPFLQKFFPDVYRKQQASSSTASSAYCNFDSQILSLFTSSLFVAAIFGGFLGCYTTVRFGRVRTMLYSGLCFLAGAVLCGSAVDITMLVAGRLTLGAAVGMANQAVPLYLCEMSPVKRRGALNQLFQQATTIGILAAQLINYGTSHLGDGWRVSLYLNIVPAIFLIIGGIFCPETPNSLVERGRTSQGRKNLQLARGRDANIEIEFRGICDATTHDVKESNFAIFRPEYRPQLVWAILIPAFQQLTGINAIMFYIAPFFEILGFGGNTSLLTAIIIGSINMLATIVSIVFVDRVGRRWLFVEGGIQMFLCQMAIGFVLCFTFTGAGTIPTWAGISVIALICVYVAAFAWSWGPLGWLVPSEMHTMESRSMGQAITVGVNFLFTFIVGQLFLTMLCKFEYGIFWFFGGWVLVMTITVYLYLPETKGVSLESMGEVWAQHWYWRRWSIRVNFTDDS